MSALLKSLIVLLLIVGAGYGVYVSGLLTDEGLAPAPVKPWANNGLVDPNEIQDFMAALDSRSVDGWNAFLAIHKRGVYAQRARTEVEKLLVAAKTTTPAAEVSSGTLEGKAASENAPAPLPSAKTEVTSLPGDFLTAQQSRSVDGWNAFLAVHRSGIYAQIAREELEKLLPAAKATSPAAGVPSVASPEGNAASASTPPATPRADAEAPSAKATSPAAEPSRESPEGKAATENAPSKPPSPVTEVASAKTTTPAAETPDGVSPGSTNAPKVQPPPATEVASVKAAAEGPTGASAEGKTESDKAPSNPPFPETDVAAAKETAAAAEGPRGLARTPAMADVPNAAPSGEQAARENARPALRVGGTNVAALTSDETCKRDEDRLLQLRLSPSREEAQRLATELSCEALRPQVQRLMESLDLAAPAGSASNDPSRTPERPVVDTETQTLVAAAKSTVAAPPERVAVPWAGSIG